MKTILSLTFGLAAATPIIADRDQTMNEPFEITQKGLTLAYDFWGHSLRQRYMLPEGMPPPNELAPIRDGTDLEISVHVTGMDGNDRKRYAGDPGPTLAFLERRERDTELGSETVIVLKDENTGLKVESHYLFHDASPTARRFTRLINEGEESLGIEYVSSAVLNNFADFGSSNPDDKLRIHYARSSWFAEAQWQSVPPSELGWADNRYFQLGGIEIESAGSWSSFSYLPMAMVENRDIGVTWFWQIEHNGSWQWKMSDSKASYDRETNTIPLANKGSYLFIGGPDEKNAHAWKSLEPGETYTTVPVALGCVRGGFEEAVEALTRYRRAALLQPHPDNRDCPVIFNDYMNCLMGDPTSEKLRPLIDAAADLGCDYFVIDAGWYGERDENWWASRGVYKPSQTRFENGLPALMERIEDAGMIPGIWLELENAGKNAPIASKPDDWFFVRHGKRVVEGSSILLDFRHPGVRAHANEVVDRVVSEYKAGYIKMDYNIDAHMGTELNADSPGQGLLEHSRAFLAWLDDVYQRHPELTIENCGSGGLRMDYAMLSRAQVQSSSDQMDYRKYPSVLVGCLAAVLPEQLAVWTYPLASADPDAASFNMVSSMLSRIHQSGRIDKLAPESYAQVKNGIEVYKEILQPIVPESIPFFPLGMPKLADDVSPIAVGLRHDEKSYVAVWRLEGANRVNIPGLSGRSAKLIYPSNLGIEVDQENDELAISFPRPHMAAIVEIR